MNYIDYINIGFERIDIVDNVLFKETGYTGYILKKEIIKGISIEVCFPELDNPKLYISKSENEDSFHIIKLTTNVLKDLIENIKNRLSNSAIEDMGQLEGFPKEVIDKMLERQFEQTGKQNIELFKKHKRCCKINGGFDWGETKEYSEFWFEVIECKNFKRFFEKYPKLK